MEASLGVQDRARNKTNNPAFFGISEVQNTTDLPLIDRLQHSFSSAIMVVMGFSFCGQVSLSVFGVLLCCLHAAFSLTLVFHKRFDEVFSVLPAFDVEAPS